MEMKELLHAVDKRELFEIVKNIVRTPGTLWLLASVSLRRHNQHFYETGNPGSFQKSAIFHYGRIMLWERYFFYKNCMDWDT